MLDTRTALHCLARTWFVGAAMTTRGMQHLGLLFALEPGLRALHPAPPALFAARQRYMAHVNTHPFMAPLFTGIVLAMEQLVAEKRMGPQGLDMLAATTATTLSALGDSFFSGTLLVTWALATTICVMQGYVHVAAGWTLLLFALLWAFRVWTFFLGLRHGIAALQWVKQMDLINWGDRLKMVNALLLALVLWDMAATATPVLWWGNFFWGLLCLICGSLLVNKARLPRILLLALVLVALSLGGGEPLF